VGGVEHFRRYPKGWREEERRGRRGREVGRERRVGGVMAHCQTRVICSSSVIALTTLEDLCSSVLPNF